LFVKQARVWVQAYAELFTKPKIPAFTQLLAEDSIISLNPKSKLPYFLKLWQMKLVQLPLKL
jgi:hypothetical protein